MAFLVAKNYFGIFGQIKIICLFLTLMCQTYVVIYHKKTNAIFHLWRAQKLIMRCFWKWKNFFQDFFNQVFSPGFFGDNKLFHKSCPVMLKNAIKCAKKKLFGTFGPRKKLFWHFWPQKKKLFLLSEKTKNNYFGANQEPLGRPLFIACSI